MLFPEDDDYAAAETTACVTDVHLQQSYHW